MVRLSLIRLSLIRLSLAERDQHRAGRAQLLATGFTTLEEKIRDRLGRMLGPGGFDPARDITLITVNRSPHGYTYEYNPLFDPDWQKGSHEVGRARFGPITIADSADAACTDSAIDQPTGPCRNCLRARA